MDRAEHLRLAAVSLFGLSVGDAFGETFFGEEEQVIARISKRELKEGTWEFTDDTVMAAGIFNELARKGTIEQDALAEEFAKNYLLDNYRGYGGTAHSILRAIGEGGDWKTISSGVFDGMGSMGNGAAMRVGPLGAYFHHDVRLLVEQARLSAEVTHFNHEAICGAIAVALAAAFAVNHKEHFAAEAFFKFIVTHTPDSDVRAKIGKAATLSPHSDIRHVTTVLGNGTKLTAQDTVPFALWCAAHHASDFGEALWTAVSGLGDRDTICAIMGSIVSLSADLKTIPEEWKMRTEKVTETFVDNSAVAAVFMFG